MRCTLWNPFRPFASSQPGLRGWRFTKIFRICEGHAPGATLFIWRQSWDPACELDQKTTIEINYAATRMLIEIAKGYGVERFLFASSCSVYGATDEVMDRKSTVEPVFSVRRDKVSSDRRCLKARRELPSGYHALCDGIWTSNRSRFDLV